MLGFIIRMRFEIESINLTIFVVPSTSLIVMRLMWFIDGVVERGKPTLVWMIERT